LLTALKVVDFAVLVGQCERIALPLQCCLVVAERRPHCSDAILIQTVVSLPACGVVSRPRSGEHTPGQKLLVLVA